MTARTWKAISFGSYYETYQETLDFNLKNSYQQFQMYWTSLQLQSHPFSILYQEPSECVRHSISTDILGRAFCFNRQKCKKIPCRQRNQELKKYVFYSCNQLTNQFIKTLILKAPYAYFLCIGVMQSQSIGMNLNVCRKKAKDYEPQNRAMFLNKTFSLITIETIFLNQLTELLLPSLGKLNIQPDTFSETKPN